MDQLGTVFTLTCYRYGRLGQYGAAIVDEPALHAVEAFQGALAAVHTAVEERNKLAATGPPVPVSRSGTDPELEQHLSGCGAPTGARGGDEAIP